MSTTRVAEVDAELLARTLECYLPHVRYLTGAAVEYSPDGHEFDTELGPCLALARGSFQAPPAWYIRATGHFNSIEFNLCYNQLAYVMLAQCLVEGCLPKLGAHIPRAEYHDRMLSDILIATYSVTFGHPMDTSEFKAYLAIQKLIGKKRRLFLKTHCRVSDDGTTWSSRGDVTLVIVSGAQAGG